MEQRIRTYFTTLHEEKYLSIDEAKALTLARIAEHYPATQHQQAHAILKRIVKQACDEQHRNLSLLSMRGYI